MIVRYRIRYVNGDKFIYRFFMTVIICIISILLMIINGPRLFRILFGIY